MDPRPRNILIAIALALALEAVPPAHGAWLPNTTPAAVAPSLQDQVSAAPDGAGGTIIAWRDGRTDAGDIYVQHLSSTGDVLWGPGGIAICAAANLQQLPQIVSDDQGGAIVVWEDLRTDPTGDIYAQRVNASGAPLWVPNGVPLITGPGENLETVSRFRAIRDGYGGAIFTFSDSRNTAFVLEPGISKVWAERVTSAGSPLWSPGGLPVAAAPGVKYDNASVASDGLGGCIVSYQEAGAGWDIRAARLDAGGAALWTGITLCNVPQDQYLPEIVADGGGGAVVAWVDNRLDPSGDIYAQRVDPSGTPLWVAQGAPLVTGPSANMATEYAIRMTPDGVGGFDLAFADDRKSGGVPDIGFSKVWAQRVDLLGNPQWGNGVPVDGDAGAHTRPSIVTDGQGGSIVVWQKSATVTNQNVFAQRFDVAGSAQWGPGTTLCNDLAPQTGPVAVADGLGGVLAAWSDARTDNGDVYANKIDFAGVPGQSSGWQCTGFAPEIPATIAVGVQDQAVVAEDGAGGLFVAWHDQQVDAGDIYAQHVDHDGHVLWGLTGFPICAQPGLQQQPRIVPDGVGGAIIAWQDDRVDPNGDMVAQRVSASGAIYWAAGGVPMVLGPSANTQSASSFRMIEDGTGGAIFTFRDNRDAGGTLSAFPRVWAQRVSSAGAPLWGNGSIVGGGVSTQDFGAPVSDGSGGVIVAWENRSGGTFDISAQRLDFAGAPRWGGGVTVCNAANDQVLPDIVSDGEGGVIIGWSDSRVDPNGDIYAQRVSSSGSPVWAANGIPEITGPSVNNVGEYLIRMVSDGAGGAIFAFDDNRDSGGVLDPVNIKVWAQHIKPSGFPEWGNGVPVAAADGVYDQFQVVSDGEGGATVVWHDRPVAPAAIRAQRLRPNGSEYWVPGGAAICVPGGVGTHTSPSVASDGRGQAIVAWIDTRSGTADVYVQKACVAYLMAGVADGDAPSARPALGAPAPNPTGNAVAYTITLRRREAVRVFLTDVQGRVVETLLDRTLDAGEHTFEWSRERSTGSLAGGVYFLGLVSPEERASRKLVLLK
jgi:hypothetical protein